MRRTISLDGDWERRDFLDEAWRWSDALWGGSEGAASDGPPVQAGVSGGWRPARVPGSAIDDAWRSGEIPNPYVDRNSLAAEWVAQRTWLYRRRIRDAPAAGERAALRFEGIDPGGAIFLDGEEIGRHAGMFVPAEIDVTDRLQPGREHDLVVAVDPAPDLPSQVGRTELARHHKSRMGYGWDFCPRMVHTGIWRPVSLDLYRARIGRARVSVVVADGRRSATVAVDAPIEGETAGARLTARVIDPGDVEVARADARADAASVRIELRVEEPRLWWPNGTGSPEMHRLQLALDAGGERMDVRTVPFGIRSVEAAPTDGASEGALPYTMVVNGRPTWVRGWNWVPIDAAYGVPRPERTRHLVELARRANVNLLRVWGGGLIESDELYDACDAAGIMIWQEFSQSSSGVSNTPADDPAFVELMRGEAEAIVPLRTNHPSLVMWCGGNELAGADGRPLDEGHPVLAALRDVVGRLDPTRIWRPTSPSGPRFDNSLAAIRQDPASLHDVHGPWEHQGLAEQHGLADGGTNLLHSEFGTEGMANPETLSASVTEPHRAPADRSNPVMAHRGAWWNNEPFVQRAFGGGLRAVELARASQHLQADGLRTLIDGDRRRWPRNAGAIPWQLNEPFPNAWCTAAVDYFGIPKAAYWAVAEAYLPISVGLGFDTQALDGAGQLTVRAWVANDTPQQLDGDLRIRLHDGVGLLLADASLAVAAAANAVTEAPTSILQPPSDSNDLLVLDATFGSSRSRRLLSRTADLAPFLRLARCELEAAVRATGDCWTVRLEAVGPAAALEVRLFDARRPGWPERAGQARFDANFVTLLPGEQRTVRVDWDDVAPADRLLRLSGWNVDDRVLADA